MTVRVMRHGVDIITLQPSRYLLFEVPRGKNEKGEKRERSSMLGSNWGQLLELVQLYRLS